MQKKHPAQAMDELLDRVVMAGALQDELMEVIEKAQVPIEAATLGLEKVIEALNDRILAQSNRRRRVSF